MKFASLLFIGIAILTAQELEKDRPAERLRWFTASRIGPDGKLPGHLRVRALREAGRMTKQPHIAGAASESTGQWMSIGPRSFIANKTSVWSGRIAALAADRNNPDLVYLGASDGGVWKSADGGATWLPLTDSQPSLSIGSLALDPQNPSIVYAGTGEANLCTDCYFGVGILKTTDGGATWTNIQAPFVDSFGRGAHIGSIAVHPQSSRILLAAANFAVPLSEGGDLPLPGGIFRSSDAGTTWSQVYGSGGAAGGTGDSLCQPDITCASTVMFNPANPSQAFAGIFGRGVLASNDAGLTWQPANGSSKGSIALTNAGRIEMAVAASNPQVLYAAVSHFDPTVGSLLGVYKSIDGAQSWTKLTVPDYCTPQCWNSQVVAVDPSNPDIVFVGGLNLYRSLDGGQTWAPTVGGVTGDHVDFHALAFAGNATRLYAGNDGGVFSTSNHRAATATWKTLNATLTITQYYPGFSIHPGDANLMYAGAQDNGTQLYSGNPVWQTVPACGDGGWTAIDPTGATTVYAACFGITIVKSTDGGASFNNAVGGIDTDDRVAFIAPLVMDPRDPQRLYFGTHRLWQSRDGAASWQAVSPDLTNIPAGIPAAATHPVRDTGDDEITRGTDSPYILRAIAVAPSDPQTVYTGAGSGAIYVTTSVDAKEASGWIDRSQGLPPRFVSQINVDPASASTAYVAFSGFSGLAAGDSKGHVFRTLDMGKTWLDISGNLPNVPVNDLQLDPDLPGTLYAATDAGVFYTTNTGGSWAVLGSGLPHAVVLGIRLHRATRTLRAATHGRGMWDIAVPAAPGTNTVPGLRSATPAFVKVGSPDQTVTIDGAGFVSGTTLLWNGKPRAAAVPGSSRITLQLTSADFAAPAISQLVAVNPGPGGGASNALTFIVGTTPAINTNGIVNGASFGSPPVAGGMIASLFGTSLAPSTMTAQALPLPVLLGGVQVNVKGIPAPLIGVSPNQINLQIPWSAATAPSATVVVSVNGIESAPFTLSFGSVAPGIFSLDQTGTGQGAILIANTSLIAGPSILANAQPAVKGQPISIFCTGLGAVTPSQAAGAIAPNPPVTVVSMPTVSIGNVNATVLFAGLAPGFAGLYQVNAIVPTTVTSGNAVRVTISQFGRVSNPVTIAVQ